MYSAGERLEEEERRKELEQSRQVEDNEDNVLKSLFEMTGIQSALKHDQIMDSASHDAVFIEREGIYRICFSMPWILTYDVLY